METIDRWLKSLRLHKYTPLFKRLTYNEMLNLDEKFLVERDITKGARNKILVSVKRLNLRQDQLANMMDDLDQDNISMKEALNVLKEMLITPIPYPPNHDNPNIVSQLPPTPPSTTRSASSTGSTNEGTDTDDHSSTTSSSGSSSSPTSSPADSTSAISTASPVIALDESPSLYTTTPQTTQNLHNINCSTSSSSSTTNNYHTDPHELTHLFVDTFSKVAQRLIESIAGSEDSACHGIMAAIVDECLNHNSFTKGQKAIVARFRQHQITKEQKPRAVGYKHYQQQLQQQQQQHQQLFLRQYYQNQLQHQQVQYQRAVNIHTYSNNGTTSRHYQQQTSYTHNPHSNQFHHHHHQQQHHHNNHHHQQVNHPPPHQIILPNHLSAHRNKQQQLLQKQQQEPQQQQQQQHHQHHYQQLSQRNNHKTGGGCGVGGGGGGGSSTNVAVVDHWNGGPYNRQQFSVSPSSLSISTMGSLSTASNSDEEERTPLSDSYREYSLLGPGLTFELPFLRAKVAAATAAATSVQ